MIFKIGTSNLPPTKIKKGNLLVGTAYWIELDDSWFSWCGTNSERHEFQELLISNLFSTKDLIEYADWKLELFEG